MLGGASCFIHMVDGLRRLIHFLHDIWRQLIKYISDSKPEFKKDSDSESRTTLTPSCESIFSGARHPENWADLFKQTF